MNENSTIIRRKVFGSLLLRGETVADWSERNGLNRYTVRTLIYRFAGNEKRPKKAKATSIIESLEKDIGFKICG